MAVKPQVDLALATTSTGSISGTLTDAASNAPFAGGCVYLYASGGGYAGTGACADATGAYALPQVTPGTYTIAVYDPSGTHPTTWYGNGTSEAAAGSFSVSAGALTSGINVSVGELTGIAGVVHDAVTLGTVSGACIYATQTLGGTATYATCVGTDTASYAITGMTPGKYDIAFFDPAGLHITTHLTATVVAGHTTTGVNGTMSEITGLVGSIIDAASAAPIANACAMLYTPAGNYVSGSYRCSDATGRFIIDNLAPGTYTLAYFDPSARFVTNWYNGKATESSASAVVVVANTITTVGAARVATFGSASGQVLNADATPAANVCVYADTLAGQYTGVGACSDANGKYVLGGLAAGQYRIAYYPSGLTGISPYWYLQQGTEATGTPITIVGLSNTALSTETLTTAAASTAPGPITNLQASSADSAITLTWANPGDADYAGATIRRAPGATPPASYTDGTAVADVSAPGTTFTDTHVTGGQIYSYAIFAHDSVPSYAAAAVITTTASAAASVQHECGTISTNTTWSPAAAPVYELDCTVTIASNTTLTIAAGTIIKANGGASQLVVTGSLVASGTSASPITFTSWRDDSIGGDTNGDGSQTGPAPGDWAGIAGAPIAGDASAVLSLHYVTEAYATTGVSVSAESTSITNSTFRHLSGDGIDVAQPLGIPRVTGNTVTTATGSAILISSSSIDLAQLNGNSGSGNGLNGVQFNNDNLTVSSVLPWTGNLVPVLYSGCYNALTVTPGVTLTLGAGTIIKSEGPNYCSGITVQGSLVATGTAASPVVLTSWRDDSVGGDTNGDGNHTGPAAGDWAGISVTPAGNGKPNPSVSADHMQISYATTGLSAYSTAVSLTNSTFTQLTGDGIDVSTPIGLPKVSGNSVSSAAGNAIYVNAASVDLSQLNGNSGSGNGLNGVEFSNDTLGVSSSLPWTGNLVPVLYGGCYNALTVPPGLTLSLGAGTLIKSEGPNYCSGITVQGNLIATGTAASPVVLTSWRDDSVGGDTNGDGNHTGPAAGDWAGIAVAPAGNGTVGPSIQMGHINVSYATTAISSDLATTSVTNSVFSQLTGDGVDVTSPVGVPTLTGNTVTAAAGNAILVNTASVDLSQLNGNSGNGNGLNGVEFSNDTLTVSSALPWTGNLVPVLYGGCYNALTVAPGITMTLGAGTLMKAEGPNYCSGITVQGNLVAAGTAVSPVVLTSWRDDSVGGDTNGDGKLTGPAAGDWAGINASSAGSGNAAPSLSLNHVLMSYAGTGISASSATTSVTNSTFAHMSGDGIDVNQSVGVPTVRGNTVTSAAGNAISLTSSSVDLALLDQNSGAGNGLNGVSINADTLAVNSALPWAGNLLPVLYGGLTVPAGLTLTLDPGTIIKGEQAGLSVQGTLVSAGTAINPVVLTSWRDDSVGGDTNGDGKLTGPAAGDWAGIAVSTAGAGNPAPAISLDHAQVSYATGGVSANNAATSVTNSSFTRIAGDAVDVNASIGTPQVAGNAITATAGSAINVYNSSIDLGLLNGNSGAGNGTNAVGLNADIVTVSSSLPWSGTLLPLVYGQLTVPPQVTVSLNAGTIVKFDGSALSVQGTLVAAGTASNPAVLTSWRDDSVGGDTNGDGSATAPVAGDWSGVSVSAAGGGNPDPVLSLDHARVQYAVTGVSAQSAVTSVTNSSWSHLTGDGIDVTQPAQSPSVVTTIESNTVSNAAGNAIAVYSASIDLTRLNGNSGTGNGINGLLLNSDTVAASSSLPWSGTLIPVVYNTLTIPPAVTVTVNAGALVKSYSGGISVQGTLNVTGTAASPVVFTSLRDDANGGDTNGDGGATAPAAGDWSGISVDPAGNGNPDPTVNLTNAQVLYATTGVGVNVQANVVGAQATFSNDITGISVQGDPVTFTNSVISNSTTGIQVAVGNTALFQGQIINTQTGAISPQGSTLDVRNTDWGSSNGPAPWGDGTLIQGGGVEVYPWAGVQPLSTTITISPPAKPVCSDVLFIGVDGSGQHPGTDTALGYEAPSSPDMRNLYASFHDALGGKRTSRVISLAYPADPVGELKKLWAGWSEYFSSYASGLYGDDKYMGLIETIISEYNACHNQNELLFVAGYSQGAWIVHDALAYLAEYDPETIDPKRMAGVVLEADPERDNDSAISVGSADSNTLGVLNYVSGAFQVALGPLPDTLIGLTKSLCNAGDYICAPSTVEIQLTGEGTSLLSGAISELGYTALLGATGKLSGQFGTANAVHTSQSPADPSARYACAWTATQECESLLSTEGVNVANRALLFAKPTGSFSFSVAANAPITEQLTASVGSEVSAKWRVQDGLALPAGLSLSTDGVLSGTVTVGSYNFTVEVSGGFEVWSAAKVSIVAT